MRCHNLYAPVVPEWLEEPSAANPLEEGGIAITEFKGFVVKPEVGGDLVFLANCPQEVKGSAPWR
jgi:hypothetical protein